MHVHPTVFGMLLRIGREYGSPPVRIPREPRAPGWLRPWLALMGARARAAGVAHNRYVLGMHDTGAMRSEHVIAHLRTLPPGVTELYFHAATERWDGIDPALAGYALEEDCGADRPRGRGRRARARDRGDHLCRPDERAMRLRSLAAFACGSLAVAALGYAAGAVVCTRSFARRRAALAASGAEPVSILVPLYGVEPELEANLRAFVTQRHAAPVQVVFGVHDASDAALPVARAVAAGHDAALSVEAPRTTANPKIANLLAMLPYARHDVLILVDSDMRVDSDYVRTVTAPLADPQVGAVTCLYGGRSAGGLAADLGAAFVNEQFAPSALVAAALGPLRHAYGATIALRRSTLDAIGGLTALGPHLADDHVLGRRIAERGLQVVLSRYVPHTLVAERELGALFRHELRWHRTIRAVAPAGYAGLFLTYPLPLALVAWACAPRQRRPRWLLPAALVLRLALARAAARAFGVRPQPWLIPLRDAFGLAVWACGLVGGGVDWRGEALQLGKGDELTD